MSVKKIATAWTRPQAVGQSPRPRCSHASCFTEGSLIICGGWAGGYKFLNDLHIFSFGTFLITMLLPFHHPLSKRFNFFKKKSVFFSSFSCRINYFRLMGFILSDFPNFNYSPLPTLLTPLLTY